MSVLVGPSHGVRFLGGAHASPQDQGAPLHLPIQILPTLREGPRHLQFLIL